MFTPQYDVLYVATHWLARYRARLSIAGRIDTHTNVSATQNPVCKIHFPKTKIQIPKLGFQNSKFKIQIPFSKIQNWDFINHFYKDKATYKGFRDRVSISNKGKHLYTTISYVLYR